MLKCFNNSQVFYTISSNIFRCSRFKWLEVISVLFPIPISFINLLHNNLKFYCTVSRPSCLFAKGMFYIGCFSKPIWTLNCSRLIFDTVLRCYYITQTANIDFRILRTVKNLHLLHFRIQKFIKFGPQNVNTFGWTWNNVQIW